MQILRQKIEAAIERAIEGLGEASPLRSACSYAVFSGGKRVRPLMVLLIAEALGHGLDVMPAALGVEFFHTASLIADDLPCMDNETLRRNLRTVHLEFNESTAVLASYTLIAAGYGAIHENTKVMKQHPGFSFRACDAALHCLSAATRCAGLKGATSGQYFDLFPPKLSWELLEKILYQKTVTLFEIAFFFGWLFGGGDPAFLTPLKRCAYHLGLSFQIADDLIDYEQDIENNTLNTAVFLGKEKAAALFQEHAAQLEDTLQELGLWTFAIQELYSTLVMRV